MAQTDLLFILPQDGSVPANLVFGDDGTPSTPTWDLQVAGRISGLRIKVGVAVVKDLTIPSARISGLRMVVNATYRSGAQRPVVAKVTAPFQQGVPTNHQVRARFDEAAALRSGERLAYQQAQPINDGARAVWQEAQSILRDARMAYERAERLATAVLKTLYQDGARMRNGRAAAYEQANKFNTPTVKVRYEDGIKRRNQTAAGFTDADPYLVSFTERGGVAVSVWADWRGKYQEARKPTAGMYVPPQPPEPEPCYLPQVPTHLVFTRPWPTDSNLLFMCKEGEGPPPEPGETIVVPVKEVYLTINSALLTRLDNGQIIPATAMSMSLDVDSWTWSFSASVPGAALAAVQHNSNGDPVIAQATINGTAFRFLLERIGRERSFNSAQLRISGRGLAAELDAPYAALQSFGNTQARTARQLLDDILTVNGVPLPWQVDQFAATDWAVPANVFSHQGSYISAINAVVGSIGGYVQPHNTDRKLNVLLRYPQGPWAWGGVTPDFELPAAVTTQEGFEWVSKANYNRVFVTGQTAGVLGQVTRTGTAGDLLAPMVTDPLITHADAARQRGIAELSDTGRIAMVTLRLPVLAETGIIKPGKFVHYKEGSNTHVGLTRAVALDVNLPTIYQTLTVETHLEPV